ncbi:MAG: S8 family serine peptidase [Clostridia bacterium]|nr:S8 family serine peptidase [Clostridia bacterium]
MSVHIAVIDDGINEKLYGTTDLKYNIEITTDLSVKERKNYDPFQPSHGTNCAAIIKKYAEDAVLSSIKILNEDTFKGERDQLITAIHWCADKGIRLINLSLGTIDFRDFDRVREVVRYASQKGLIIVAACNNRNVFTYPASLSSVIGVKSHHGRKLKEDGYFYNPFPVDGVEITASGKHTLINYEGKCKTTYPCNSYAAPLITAVVCNILKNHSEATLDDIREFLRKGAVNQIHKGFSPHDARTIDFVENAVVFNLTGNPLSGFPYDFCVKETVDITCEGMKKALGTVQEYLSLNLAKMNDADSVVLIAKGDEKSSGMINKFIEDVALYGKNVIFIEESLDLYSKLRCKSHTKNIKVWKPYDGKRFYKSNNKKRKLNIPVVPIYDYTGMEFIKLEKCLKNHFGSDGYNVVAATDSPLGIAAGLEVVPLQKKYNNCIYCDIAGLEILNRVYDPDILLVGINVQRMEKGFLKGIETAAEADIRIIITDGKGIVPDIPEANGCETIVLSMGDNFEFTQQQPVKPFVYRGEETFIEIYKYIINLFEKENGAC